ncbi:MAG: hypothetical protein ACYTG5_19405 [Planctomycetota bacterium]|jgi:hypothetical protein
MDLSPTRLKEWSDKAKLLYLRLRVEGMSQIKAQDAVRKEFGIEHIYKQQVLSHFERSLDSKKITADYLAQQQDKFGDLPFAKRYERIAANAEMAHVLANRFWEENKKGDEASHTALTMYSKEFRGILDSIKGDVVGMGVEELQGKSGFEAVFTEGLKALGVAQDKLAAMGISSDDLKVEPN